MVKRDELPSAIEHRAAGATGLGRRVIVHAKIGGRSVVYQSVVLHRKHEPAAARVADDVEALAAVDGRQRIGNRVRLESRRLRGKLQDGVIELIGRRLGQYSDKTRRKRLAAGIAQRMERHLRIGDA